MAFLDVKFRLGDKIRFGTFSFVTDQSGSLVKQDPVALSAAAAPSDLGVSKALLVDRKISLTHQLLLDLSNVVAEYRALQMEALPGQRYGPSASLLVDPSSGQRQKLLAHRRRQYPGDNGDDDDAEDDLPLADRQPPTSSDQPTDLLLEDEAWQNQDQASFHVTSCLCSLPFLILSIYSILSAGWSKSTPQSTKAPKVSMSNDTALTPASRLIDLAHSVVTPSSLQTKLVKSPGAPTLMQTATPPLTAKMQTPEKDKSALVVEKPSGRPDAEDMEILHNHREASKGTHGSDDEDMDHAIALSLSEEDQRKKGKTADGAAKNNEEEGVAAVFGTTTTIWTNTAAHSTFFSFAAATTITDTDRQLDEDEQLARALQESMNDGPPRPNIPVNDGPTHRNIPINDGPPGDIPIKDVPSESAPASILPPYMFPLSGSRVCAGCKTPIGHGRFLSCMDSVWHPQCFRCYACDIPISEYEEFYEGLNMKVEQQIPLLLVERQALNEAMEAEKTGHHLAETRGLCLSEEQIVRSILRRPIIGPGNKIIEMVTGPYRLVRKCEVTAILILYGLPRLLTGSILAHEMMHAYLRLKGYRTLSPEVEEGICQVLAHLWLESEITSGSGSSITTSSAASSSSSAPPSSKKGAKTDFEKKLGEFFKHQIETDSSVAYGDGFRAGIRAVELYGLRSTLDHIKLTGSFPY
ncbi:hypothetical protein PR202_ga12667 [Eleusine coracana subsp. coracana]|uniref:LIM zinc-binding domain-containing protein n=1 Tax=Eleusine coracana subsp. coracana TaxID=191504 RepID=A0AAV5CCU2_ELECO|nr:hypothetical protein PR202_ga12667 [Eleusine coracana subsp. coracana]